MYVCIYSQKNITYMHTDIHIDFKIYFQTPCPPFTSHFYQKLAYGDFRLAYFFV